MKGSVLECTVTGFQVVGPGVVWCLASGSENSRRERGIPDPSGIIGRGNSNSHCGNDNILKIHTPLSKMPSFLLGLQSRAVRECFQV